MSVDDYSLQLGAMFTQAIANNTTEWVSIKMREVKVKKKGQEQEIAFQEIVNELLEKNMELESIARQYKALYEKVNISDDDIEYLHNTMMQAIGVLGEFSPNVKKESENLEAITKLINKDVLKTMQMLGFNYTEAIGEPLTEACSTAITSKLGVKSVPKNKKTR